MHSDKDNFKITPLCLEVHGLKVNGFAYLPENPENKIAVFSHGYTSHKASILNWCTALMEKNISSLVFDLPGHLLGGFYPLISFKTFSEYTHLLFFEGLKKLLAEINLEEQNVEIFFGGHSLGGLFALKALKAYQGNATTIGVGLGINVNQTHLYSTKLFEKTLQIRNSYVDAKISTDKVFPWIKEQKENLNLNEKRIHLICGEDDLVVGKGGMRKLADLLSSNNEVSFDEPHRLAHHLPEHAAKLIVKFITSYS